MPAQTPAPLRQYLFMLEDTDDDGRPLDWGVVNAARLSEATRMIEARVAELSLGLDSVDVSIYPVDNPGAPGIPETSAKITRALTLTRAPGARAAKLAPERVRGRVYCDYLNGLELLDSGVIVVDCRDLASGALVDGAMGKEWNAQRDALRARGSGSAEWGRWLRDERTGGVFRLRPARCGAGCVCAADIQWAVVAVVVPK